MNWYTIFYWLTVADNFKAFFVTFIVITMIGAIIAGFCWLIGRDESDWTDVSNTGRAGKKIFLYFFPFVILFWFLYLFTPSKSDTLLIIAGGSVGNFITNDTNSRAIPADITKFLRIKLNEQIIDANDEVKRQFNMQTPKERLIDKAKEMTKDELILFLQNDTILVNKN